MAFGIGQVNSLNSSLNSLNSAFSRTSSTASTASKRLSKSSRSIGDIVNQVKLAQMALKQLRNGWMFLVEGAARSSKSLRKDLDRLSAAYKRLQTNMGSGVAPAFEFVAETLTGVLQLLNEHKSVAKALGVAMAGLLSILSVVAVEYALLSAKVALVDGLMKSTRTGTYLLAAAEKAWAAATNYVTKAKKWLAAVMTKENLLKAASAAKSAALTVAEYALAGAKWAVAAGAGAASVAVGLLGAALSALGIGPILMLVGALITGLALLADHFGLINLDPIIGGFQSLAGTLGGLVPSVDQVLSLLGSLAGVGGKPKGMMEWAQTLLGLIFPIIPIAKHVLRYFGLLGDVGSMLQSAVSGVTGFVESLLGGIQRLVSNPKKTLAKFAQAGVDFVKTMAGKIASKGPKLVTDAISSALGAVLPFLPSSDADRGPLSNLTGAGMALVKTIAKGILGAPAAILGALGSVLSGLLGSIGGAVASLGAEIANGIASGIKGAAGAVAGAVKGVVSAAKGAVDAVGGVVSGVTSAVGGAVSGAANAVGGAADAVGGAVGGAANAVGGAVSGAANAASNVGNAVGAAGKAAGNVVGGIGNAASDLTGGLLGGGGGGGKTQRNNTQIHFHGEVHDAQKVDKKVRKAQRQAVKGAQGGIEDALEMGVGAANSLL